MSVGLPSDEVAEDYKNSLEDLTINSRYEISNLTVIAKENTEHAMAISRVLENHIKSVSTYTSPPESMVIARVLIEGCLPMLMRCIIKNNPNHSVDSSRPQAASTVRPRFCGQKCWNTLHTLPWS